jgi:hypothetical protein
MTRSAGFVRPTGRLSCTAKCIVAVTRSRAVQVSNSDYCDMLPIKGFLSSFVSAAPIVERRTASVLEGCRRGYGHCSRFILVKHGRPVLGRRLFAAYMLF